MNNKSQIKSVSIFKHSFVLVSIFIIAGLVMPVYVTPFLYNVLPINTPYNDNGAEVSLQITNRNLTSGQTFNLKTSSPEQSAHITELTYPCSSDNINLVYQTREGSKRLPCNASIQLPQNNQHRIQMKTSRQSLVYLPINLRIESGSLSATTSLQIAATADHVTDRSELVDDKTVTVDLAP